MRRDLSQEETDDKTEGTGALEDKFLEKARRCGYNMARILGAAPDTMRVPLEKGLARFMVARLRSSARRTLALGAVLQECSVSLRCMECPVGNATSVSSSDVVAFTSAVGNEHVGRVENPMAAVSSCVAQASVLPRGEAELHEAIPEIRQLGTWALMVGQNSSEPEDSEDDQDEEKPANSTEAPAGAVGPRLKDHKEGDGTSLMMTMASGSGGGGRPPWKPPPRDRMVGKARGRTPKQKARPKPKVRRTTRMVQFPKREQLSDMVQVEYEEEDDVPTKSEERGLNNMVTRARPERTTLPSKSKSPDDTMDVVQNAANDEGLAEPAPSGTVAEDEHVAGEETGEQEQTVRRWRRILAMEDEGDLMDQSVLSYEQHESVCRAYERTPEAERSLFLLGFNAYMASLMMEVTLRIKEVELGVMDEANGTQESPEGTSRKR